MLKPLYLFLFIISFYINAQITNEETLNVDSNAIVEKDTVVIYKFLDEKYAYEQILEKTNKQLSLWWNPYGVFIASLGVLFAILTIISAFVIFRQSREYKKLISDSLNEHKDALNRLVAEKESQYQFYNEILDNTIQEYREVVSKINKDEKNLISDFISKLEDLKLFVNTQVQVYKHSGWKYKDIFVNYPITKSTTINIKISLIVPKQLFVIYFRVVANDNRKYWIGFAGNTGKFQKEHLKREYTIHREHAEKEISIDENIYDVFKEGFKNIDPRIIDCVRLRGSKTDIREITFIYQINY